MKENKITAYERRRINSEKIASVQFEPKYHTSSEYENTEKEQKWRKQKIKETHAEKKNVKPVWTPLDQIKEEELWDE